MNVIAKIKSISRLLLSSRTARLNIALLFGVIVNIAYIFGNLASALIYHSIWAATLGAYHLILITMRLYLLYQGRRYSKENFCSVSFRVGVLLLFLALAQAIIMIYTVLQGRFVRYSGIFLLAFLIYSVYSLSISVITLKKHRSDRNNLHFVARSITLSTSLMSIFNLQYSVLSLIGAPSRLTIAIVISSAVAVFLLIIILSLRLLVLGSKK